MPPDSSQKRYLRGLAHSLKPVIMVGNKGVSDALFAEFSIALDNHELIKVKLAGDDRKNGGADRQACRGRLPSSSRRSARSLFLSAQRDKPKLITEMTAVCRHHSNCAECKSIRDRPHEHAADRTPQRAPAVRAQGRRSSVT
jgi:RNA-binding protein YhbY